MACGARTFPAGVLSGEKQRIGRDYDFASVISWFAERYEHTCSLQVDLIGFASRCLEVMRKYEMSVPVEMQMAYALRCGKLSAFASLSAPYGNNSAHYGTGQI